MPIDTDPWALVSDRFKPRPDYASDPNRWLTERVGEFAWSTQRQIMQALVEQRMVAVPSCHGVGKSHIASRIAAWWIDVHGTDPTEVFMVTTAPTAAQVSAVLWRYIGQLHRKAELPGRINRSPWSSWYLEGELVAYGRKPADYEESAFQGIHAAWTLIIVDEACGILPNLWDQLSSLASNLNARILAIGNPTDAASHFYQVCQPASDWHTIWIDALRTPNMSEEGTRDYPLTRLLMQALKIPFSIEDVPEKVAESLVSPLYVEERIRSYCGFTKTSHKEVEPADLADQLIRRTNNSPMFLARVRGVFPTNASSGVIPLAWVELAVQRWHDWEDAGMPEPPGRRVIGVDVAYYGEDETVLAIRQGNVVQKLIIATKQDTVETADQVHPWLNWPQALAVIDANGVGAGVYDTLRRRHREGHVLGTAIPFIAQARTKRTDMTLGEFSFRTDRDAAWWRMRVLLDPSRGSQVALPDDELLKLDLTTPKYKVMTGGVIVVESKDDTKKRMNRSTDRGDAVIQSWWIEGAVVDSPDEGRVATMRNGVVQYDGYTPIAHSGLFDDAVMAGGWQQ